MKIHNINCKIVETEITASTDFKNLLSTIEIKDNFTSYKDKKSASILSDFIGRQYRNNLTDIINCFTDVKKLVAYEISDCWVQKYNNKKHDIHVHGNNNEKLSFVWYINASHESSPIKFYNPGYPYMDHWSKEIHPNKDKFLMFNSYIPHEVAINKDDVRMVVSGNIDLLWQR